MFVIVVSLENVSIFLKYVIRMLHRTCYTYGFHTDSSNKCSFGRRHTYVCYVIST